MRFLLISIIFIALFLPFQVLGGPIVPCGRCCKDLNADGTKCVVPCDNVPLEQAHPCTLCHLFELASNVVQFLLQFALVIAPVFILIGGIMILASAGVPDRVALGKRIITSAVIGVIIALGAWAILGTLFNALIGGPGFPWPWNTFTC